MNLRRALRPGVLLAAAAAAAWLAAAYALWDTRVPGDLRVPDLDPEKVFPPRVVDKASDYESFLRIEYVLAQLATLLALSIYAWRGPRLARESAAGPIGTGMLLGMLGLGILWFVEVPFQLVAVWWDRRHDVSDAGYVEVVLGNWLALGVGFLFICLALLVVMGFARAIGDRWWLPAAPVFVGLVAVFAFVTPYLIPDQRPLRRPALAADARQLAREQGVRDVEVKVEEVSEYTDAPNAFAAGFGGSRRVVLWDTLLDGRLSRDEVRFVISHEFAHHAREHILKGVGWYALFAFPGAFLIALATRHRGGMAAPRAVPLALLVLVALQLAAQPLDNVISRRMEAEADWVALQATEDPDAARGLFEHFTAEALSDPDPPRWSYFLVDTHPSGLERIEMAEAWRKAQPLGRRGSSGTAGGDQPGGAAEAPPRRRVITRPIARRSPAS